ncbi:pyrimidine 5'-nucleotidase [bacterium]|nr:pyrimidine 5'-nucleotidase [bacterium]
MVYSTLLIDLDGTVYPSNNGIWDEIGARMEKYMQDVLKLPPADIPILRKEYYKKFGTTLSGLRNNHKIDEIDFLSYVHNVPLHQYLAPDIKLREILTNLPQKKWIFTNSDINHSRRVLKALNVLDQFDGILDITFFNFLNKPHIQTYQMALESIGSPDPSTCIFIDDSPVNLPPAKDLGITTVLVGDRLVNNSADYHIASIYELESIIALAEGQ